MDIDNVEVREISMPPLRTEPKYIYFRGSKICTEPRSGINFVIEFETDSGTPLSLWRKLVLNNEIVYRLGVVMCGELRQTATSPFAGTLLLGEFSVEELEYLTGRKIRVSSQPMTSMRSRNNMKTDPVRSYRNSSQPTTESPTLYAFGPTDLLQSGRSSRLRTIYGSLCGPTKTRVVCKCRGRPAG